jgi:hypothetical protein
MNIGWPEGIYLTMVAVVLILTAFLHGTPRTDKWDFHLSAWSYCVTLGLLYWGGFFS